MTKKADSKARASKLHAIANTIADKLKAHESTGSLVVQICTAVQGLYRGADIPAEEMEFMLDDVSRAMKWTSKSADKRKLETKAILVASESLPTAIARASKQMPVPFYQALKLARLINGGKTAIQAASALVNGKKADKVEAKDRDVATAWKSVNTHLKRILEHTQLPKRFRAEVRMLADDFSELNI